MDGGGSEKQLLYLLQNLPRDRFDIRLYLLYRTGSLLPEVPKDVPITSYWEDRAFPRFNWPGRIHRSQVQHLKGTLESEGIQVVYDRLYHMTLITGPATSALNIPRASTIVSPPSKDLVRNEKRWLKQKKAKLSKAYAESDALLCVDEGTADDASKFYGINRSQLQVVRSPIDVKRIDLAAQMPIENYRWDDSKKHIISVGRLSEEKGHRYLIRAVAKYLENRSSLSLPDVMLHLVGDGVLRKELESLANSLQLQEVVQFHGQQANPIAYLKRSDLFILPSLYEGFPNSVLEAMACEVPVITTSRAGGVPSVLRSIGAGHIVGAASVDDLTEAIENHFRTPDKLLQSTNAARQYVLEKHDLSGWIDRLSDLLESLKRSSRQGPSASSR